MSEQKRYTLLLPFGEVEFVPDQAVGGGAARELAEGAHAVHELAYAASLTTEGEIDAKDMCRAMMVFAQWVQIGALGAQQEFDSAWSLYGNTNRELRKERGEPLAPWDREEVES